MVDLHTHILPDIDDGPENVRESVELVRLEISRGVDTVAFTPHFIPDISDNVSDFCDKRRRSSDMLNNALSKEAISINTVEGAEVALSAELPRLKDLEYLAISGTDYMLVELPRLFYYSWVPQALYNLRLLGFTPILAHVERFGYIQEDPDILYELVDSGCMAQVNAASLATGGHAQLRGIAGLMRRKLIHLVASDTHSVSHRPPLLNAAMASVRKRWGVDTFNYLNANAKAVAQGEQPELWPPVTGNKSFLDIFKRH